MKPAFAALALLALTACSPGPSQPEAEPTAPPNVVVILADDLGYGDIGANGGTIIQTPHIDALARDGVRLTDGYVSAAVCSPSRAGLYTGRYQERLGFEFNVAQRDDRIGLPTDQRTIADMMKAAGYSTGLVGKWHQGKQKEYHPLSRGFDEYYGMLAGGSVYIDSRVQGVEAWPPDRQPIGRSDANAIFDGFEKVDPPEYLTDVFTRKAGDFIDRHKDERFFLMLTPNTPHTPLQATAKYLDRYRHIEEPNKRIYAAMVASLDDMVGAVVAKLCEHGLEENTLLVFFSDNGCAGYVNNACSNAPLNGFKRFHLDGGIRVPFIFKWPAGLPKGTTFEHPGDFARPVRHVGRRRGLRRHGSRQREPAAASPWRVSRSAPRVSLLARQAEPRGPLGQMEALEGQQEHPGKRGHDRHGQPAAAVSRLAR